MQDEDAHTLDVGTPLLVHAVVAAAPMMAGYPHLQRIEPSATGTGAWVDIGSGRVKQQIWVAMGSIEKVVAS